MKRIPMLMLLALMASGGAALAQGMPPGPPPDGPGMAAPPPGPPPLGDPELARLTTDIVILRAINQMNATPEQLSKVADLLRDLVKAERDLRERGQRTLADERER